MLEQRQYGSFQRLCNLLIILGLLNFGAFLAGTLYLGGDAVNGKVEAGRYYLFGLRAQSWRKGYTEVSEPVFTYSKWHTYSVLATWPVVMAAAFVSSQIQKRIE
jgi:hypothetical protein